MSDKTNSRFLVDLPDQWEDRTVYTFMGPEDGGHQHILTLIIDPELDSDDLTDFAQERIDQVTQTLQGMEILKEGPRTLDNGNEAYECVYKWIPVDGKIIFQKLIYLIVDGAGYTFSAGFTKKTIKTLGVEVEGIINSFTPKVQITPVDN